MTERDRSPPVIADEIRALVRAGVARPGDHLSAIELASRFGVSRGPVREALRLLESAGVVRIVPQKGAFVMALDDGAIQDLLSIREVLFALLAERCSERASDADLASLERAVAELGALSAKPECSAREFQAATDRIVSRLYRISRMPGLSLMIQNISSGPAELFGPLAVATRDMRLADLRGYQRLLKAMQSRHSGAVFNAARAMHAEGVKRAEELSAVMPRAAPESPAALKGRRRRR
ncbi:MAG: GntR family transcriptional regulator [Brevundimonas sp.]